MNLDGRDYVRLMRSCGTGRVSTRGCAMNLKPGVGRSAQADGSGPEGAVGRDPRATGRSWNRAACRGRRHTAAGSAEDRGARPEVTGEGRVKVRPAGAVRSSSLAPLPAEEARAPGAPEVAV